MIEIINATYGDVDCKDILVSKIINNKLIIRANNDICGDTKPGHVKNLIIDAIIEGIQVNSITKEGDLLVMPASTNNRLGIFYSNNTNSKLVPSVTASLNSIKVASQSIADIYTCVWDSVPNNPFYQCNAWTRTSSHLNQLLQIMQLLYLAKSAGKYKYVSFLEHDVLYPEGYFKYPDFNQGSILTNMNYGGINRDGWQKRYQDDEPFHQMTMHFDDALKHCNTILENALLTNSGLIEPQNLKREQWQCENEAIHINHGHHFTSHYTIYDIDNTYLDHPYWGNHIKYAHLLDV